MTVSFRLNIFIFSVAINLILELRDETPRLIDAAYYAAAGSKILALFAELGAGAEGIGRIECWTENRSVPNRIDGEISGVISEDRVGDQIRRRNVLQRI